MCSVEEAMSSCFFNPNLEKFPWLQALLGAQKEPSSYLLLEAQLWEGLATTERTLSLKSRYSGAGLHHSHD